MNIAAAIARFFRVAATRRGALPTERAPLQVAATPPRGSARRTVAWFVVATLGLHVGAVLALDAAWPALRDPEYGRRVTRLKARTAEHPGRPVVLAVGSSRISMGVRPAAWEDVRPDQPGRPDPLLFNMALVGSGPIMELMCLRRVYADGFRPAAVVLEYWPPFYREDNQFFEPKRIDPTRLYPGDRPLVRDYFAEPDKTEHEMRADRLNPLYRMRHRLLGQLAPKWQPWGRRMDAIWDHIDPWGWLPGLEQDLEARPFRLKHCEPIYRDQFNGYTVHPVADRAVREAVALARGHGSRVVFAYLPESSEFRGWMPPEVERMAREHLAGLCRELDVPLVDARLWLPDDRLADGFHLTRGGATEFTRRFVPAVVAALPGLGETP